MKLISSFSTANDSSSASSSLPLVPLSPSVLLSGYRAAAWICLATAGIAIVSTLLGLRGLKVLAPNSDSKAAGDRREPENQMGLENITATHVVQLADVSSDRDKVVAQAEQA
jgi:hypothetical protein